MREGGGGEAGFEAIGHEGTAAGLDFFDLRARDGFVRKIRAAQDNAGRVFGNDQASEGVVARGGDGVSGEIGRDLQTGMEDVQEQCFARTRTDGGK